jgi:hypothetical protein
MRPDIVDYAPQPSRPGKDRAAIRDLTTLFVPCIGTVFCWLRIFLNPRLGSQDTDGWTTAWFVFLVLSVAACVGALLVICRARKSLEIWLFLAAFICVALLNLYGFFWCVGQAVAAA